MLILPGSSNDEAESRCSHAVTKKFVISSQHENIEIQHNDVMNQNFNEKYNIIKSNKVT